MEETFDKIKLLIKENRWIMVFLCAVPFYNDGYVSFQILSDWQMDYVKVLVFCCLMALMIIKRKKFSLLFLSLSVFEIWWLIATIANYPFSETTVYHKTIIDIINALTVSLIVEYFKDDKNSLLLGLLFSFELAVYPELISVIRNINQNNTYILGFYSTSVLWILPALCVAALCLINTSQKIRSVLLIFACIFIEIKIWCATMIVSLLGQIGLFVFGLLLMVVARKTNKKPIKILLSVFIALSILGNVFVLFFYTGGSFPAIDAFIEKFLRRTTTFTERVVIWQESIRMIKEKPWIGHGFRPVVDVANSFADSYTHSHNQILQCLNARGIVGLAFFTIFHVILCYRTDRIQKNTVDRLVAISSAFAVTITYITEGYKKFFRFYLVFFLAYHIDEIIKDKITNTKSLNEL